MSETSPSKSRATVRRWPRDVYPRPVPGRARTRGDDAIGLANVYLASLFCARSAMDWGVHDASDLQLRSLVASFSPSPELCAPGSARPGCRNAAISVSPTGRRGMRNVLLAEQQPIRAGFSGRPTSRATSDAQQEPNPQDPPRTVDETAPRTPDDRALEARPEASICIVAGRTGAFTDRLQRGSGQLPSPTVGLRLRQARQTVPVARKIRGGEMVRRNRKGRQRPMYRLFPDDHW
jgi:hypothetical protein